MTARIHSYLEALMLSEDEPLALAEGERLFHEGEPGHQMYIVRSGTLELRLGRRLLEVVGPGGVVGEMSLVDPAPRSATAVAGPGCSVVAIDEGMFHSLVRAVPNLALEVMGIMARRLRRGNLAGAPRAMRARKPTDRSPTAAPRRPTPSPVKRRSAAPRKAS
jgi:CRP-like cAMP-binding protein